MIISLAPKLIYENNYNLICLWLGQADFDRTFDVLLQQAELVREFSYIMRSVNNFDDQKLLHVRL
jgi:hypothetical protein